MSDMKDWDTWNKNVIAEFRASEGRVGGDLEDMPIVLVYHLGRKSGRQYVNPLVYLPGENDDSIYVFASKGGAPTYPDWLCRARTHAGWLTWASTFGRHVPPAPYLILCV